MPTTDSSSFWTRLRSHLDWTAIVAALGLLWAARSVLDSFRLEGALYGPLLVLAAFLVRWGGGRQRRLYAVAATLSIAYGFAALVLIEFRADSASYFVYLRSPVFDGDLDFRNDWDALGVARTRAGDNASVNVFSVGPAVLWSPFYLAAHAYVRIESALGRDVYRRDGLSLPYRRATALGTVTVVVAGGALLTFFLAEWITLPIAILSVVGAVLASPVVYYTFAVPAMSHGVTFGVAAALVWAWDRAERQPSRRAWIVLGALFGLLMMCRWQAAVYGLLLAPLAIAGLRRGAIRLSWLAGSAAASIAAFSPQAIAWRLQFGRFLLIPQGSGFLDFTSPHVWRTLFSADHGFFNWTPLMFVGFVGLVLGLRRHAKFCGGALGVFLATVWVNGSVPAFDLGGGDAFGARRYCLVVPLMAIGLGLAIEASSRLLARRPILAPATAIVLFSVWNLGFVSHFRARKYPEMAPLERLARDQARSLREVAQDALGFLAGDRGRALAYDFFSGEYFYTSFNRNGRIYLRSADDRYLMHGWTTPSRRISRRTFRRALYPEACVRIPLREPFRLRVAITARAPEGALPQTMTVEVNGNRVTTARLKRRWREVRFVVPEDALVPGENALCLEFDNALPEENGRRIAAHVERIQLP